MSFFDAVPETACAIAAMRYAYPPARHACYLACDDEDEDVRHDMGTETCEVCSFAGFRACVRLFPLLTRKICGTLLLKSRETERHLCLI